MKHFLAFALIRVVTAPLLLLPYSAVHVIGAGLGSVAFYLLPKFRKRALSNLSLATDLHLSQEEVVHLTKQSFQNLMITCLEYPKLAREKHLERVVSCENPEVADNAGKSVIFFCAHQANWELLFLEGSRRMPGVAIGRPIKNKILYDWVLSMRQQYGGKIITPKEAVKEGLRALKKGAFLGIVGDQGMPDSGYSCPFFGRRAWTSPMPALLSYKTGCPIIFASVRREKGRYFIHYSNPLWPNQDAPMESEVDRLMRGSLKLLEDSIRKAPGQWLWQHNRWKQQPLGKIKRLFRQDTILIILSDDEEMLSHLNILRVLYPLEFITLLVPEKFVHRELLPEAEILTYKTPGEMLLHDYRFKLVLNLTDNHAARRHYLKLSAVEVVSLQDLQKLAGSFQNYSEMFKKAL